MSIIVIAIGFAGGRLPAEDWPMRLKDVHRSGITSERLTFPLERAWAYTTARRPAPAWTESPAIHDYLHKHYDLKPRQHFDRCFDVAAVGGRLYFGSSASGALTCLDAARGGEELWTFFTGGPIRFAPQVSGGKVYFGSDDGFVYCLDAAGGAVAWKERAGPSGEKIWGNEHMISVWPVRTSVLVADDEIYWCAGLFPHEGMFLCRRDAAAGSGGWTSTPVRPHQGYLAATADLLLAPSGKGVTAVYRRDNGKSAGDLNRSSRDGGCWALVTPDETEVWAGPSVDGKTQRFQAKSRTFLAAVGGANCLIAEMAGVYYNTDTRIIKLLRQGAEPTWSKELVYPFALIKAGNHLLAGGHAEVAALDTTTGKPIWKAPVDGNVYGLAVADGSLFVSTDQGSIFCFKRP